MAAASLPSIAVDSIQWHRPSAHQGLYGCNPETHHLPMLSWDTFYVSSWTRMLHSHLWEAFPKLLFGTSTVW